MNIANILHHPAEEDIVRSPSLSTSSLSSATSPTRSTKTRIEKRRQTKAACLACRRRKSKVRLDFRSRYMTGENKELTLSSVMAADPCAMLALTSPLLVATLLTKELRNSKLPRNNSICTDLCYCWCEIAHLKIEKLLSSISSLTKI